MNTPPLPEVLLKSSDEPPLLSDDLEQKLRAFVKQRPVAVVHDWMFHMRGGERVLCEILKLFPEAHLFCLFGRPREVLGAVCPQKVTFSFLAKIPFIHRVYQLLLPLFPVAIEALDLQDYQLILSTSSCVAKGVVPHPLAEHFCYIHSPMRYVWDQQRAYFNQKKPGFIKSVVFFFMNIFLSLLRCWEVTSSTRVTAFIANSAFVAKRCQRYYGRSATVVFPPIDTKRFRNSALRLGAIERKRHILLFGAWTPYKKMGAALKVLVQAGIPVVAAGTGAELIALSKAFANKKSKARVQFVVNPTPAQVEHLYAEAWGLLFPAIEDFGIIPLEATAAGCPVVAPRAGGTLETVKPGVNGWHFHPGDDDDMLAQVKQCLSAEWPPAQRNNLWHFVEENFSAQRFRDAYVRALLAHQET